MGTRTFKQEEQWNLRIFSSMFCISASSTSRLDLNIQRFFTLSTYPSTLKYWKPVVELVKSVQEDLVSFVTLNQSTISDPCPLNSSSLTTTPDLYKETLT